MSIEYFQRKQAVFATVTEALKAIEDVALQMSVPERIEVLSALHDMFHVEPGDYVYEPKSQEKKGPRPQEGKYSSPALGVTAILTGSPVPLSAGDIVTALEDRIETTSKNPRDVIYSALAYLKKEGKIKQLENKAYQLARPADDEDLFAE